ncbi:radical SAM protein [candidate division KSB1 bacterium]|nr:radical SAM protein [candidate division KSB1 bacterium]
MKNPYVKILQEFPSSLQIQTTSRCNYQCVICPYKKTESMIKHGKMDEALFEKVLKDCTDFRNYIKNIFFTLMNEPLLDASLPEKIKLAKRAFPDARTVVITNGSLLDNSRAEALINSGLDLLKISINGYYQPAYINNHDRREILQVEKNIQKFIKINENRVRLLITVVKNRLNEKEMLESIAYWKSKNITCLETPLSNRTGSVDNFDELVIDEFKSCQFGSRCTIPFSIFNILHDGRVLLCCNDWYQRGIIGNVNQESIHSIWNGIKIQKYRDGLSAGNVRDLDPCNRCKMNM